MIRLTLFVFKTLFRIIIFRLLRFRRLELDLHFAADYDKSCIGRIIPCPDTSELDSLSSSSDFSMLVFRETHYDLQTLLHYIFEGVSFPTSLCFWDNSTYASNFALLVLSECH